MWSGRCGADGSEKHLFDWVLFLVVCHCGFLRDIVICEGRVGGGEPVRL
jgi:hypothetical protein